MARFLGLFHKDHLSLYRTDRDPLTHEVERQYPRQWRYVKLLGSCRSTLCITWGGCNPYYPDPKVVALWDPFANRDSDLPPPPPAVISGLGPSVYGFGYDEWNGEYVLLRVNQILRGTIVSDVSIYRGRQNMWRRLQCRLNFLLILDTMGVFLHGRLHWIAKRSANVAKVLVAFDIHTENFMEVDLPNVIDNRLPMDLSILGGHLCLTTHPNGEPGAVDVWIRRYNGSDQPWDRLFSRDYWEYSQDNSWDYFQKIFEYVRPLAYSQDGRRVLVQLGTVKFVWYNLNTNEVERLQLGMPSSFEAATCLRLWF